MLVDMKTIIIRVQIGMDYHGYTQAELADEAGICAGTVSRLLNEHSKNLMLSTLLGLAKAIGVSPGWLCGIRRDPRRIEREDMLIGERKRVLQLVKTKAKAA